MLGRGITQEIKAKGIQYLFANISSFIKSYDIAFANLECPLSDRGKAVGNLYSFRADPKYADGLKNSGFTLFSLANNHIFDYGKDALMDTITNLNKNSLDIAGAGLNQNEARAPKLIKKNDLTFAFFAFVVDVPFGGIVNFDNTPAPAQASINEITEEIKKIRPSVDFIIVSFHWGLEYASHPTEKQKELAHKSIDAGADLILGHHPHVLQGIEKYHDKYIFYSLGNFVFDQHQYNTKQSIIVECIFEEHTISSINIYPVTITHFRPDFASNPALIGDKIKALSRDFNITIKDSDNSFMLDQNK